jgi:hypothetical protein
LIVVIDKVLSKQECEYILLLYEQFEEHSHEWRGTKPLNFKFIPEEFRSSILNKIKTIVGTVFKDIVYDWGEIVKWSPSNDQPLHLDNASNETILTSITYLNEEFLGGETYFQDGTVIKPMTGRTLIFNGMQYVHGVKEVTEGVRWTVPIWYKKQGN